MQEVAETRIAIISEAAGNSQATFPFARRTNALVDYFSRAKCEVRLLVPAESSRSTSPTNVGGVEYVKVYETRRRDLGSPLAILYIPFDVANYAVSLLRFDPHVILVAGISPFILLETVIAAKLRRVAVVFDVRDSWLLMRAVHPGRWRNAVRVLLEGFALRQGDFVVGVTETLVALMMKHYRIRQGHSMAIGNGIDRAVDAGVVPSVTYDLVHAGPLRDYYDNAGLLDAIRILASRRPSLRAAFLGAGDGKSRDWLQKELKTRDLESNVKLLPWVPPDKVVNEIRKARLGLITFTKNPSYRVAISTKSFDYMEAGIPLLYLGPEDSEQADQIRKFRLGIVANSPAEFAREADALLSNPIALRRLSASLSVAAAQLSWDDVLRPLFELVTRLGCPSLGKGQ